MIADAVEHHLAGYWARLGQRLAMALGSAVEVRPPNVFMSWRRLWSFALFDVFRELCEGAIKSLFVRVVVVPLLTGLGPELSIIIFGKISLSLILEGDMVRSEQILRLVMSEERLQYFGLVHQSLIAFELLLVVIRGSLVLIGPEEVISIGVPKAFFHVVSGHILHASFDIAIFISGVVCLIIELFHVLELRVFSTL